MFVTQLAGEVRQLARTRFSRVVLNSAVSFTEGTWASLCNARAPE